MLQNGALNSQHSVLLCKAKNDKNSSRPFELFIVFASFWVAVGGFKSSPKYGAKSSKDREKNLKKNSMMQFFYLQHLEIIQSLTVIQQNATIINSF